MDKINKITSTRFYDVDEKEAEINQILRDIEEVDKELDVMNMKVHPYGYAIPFRDIFKNLKDWRNYSSSSRSILIAEMNGCIDIINNRIDLYNEDDVQVKVLEGKYAGKIRVYKKSIAQEFIEVGFAVPI